MIELKYPLILASESPRRKELLTEAGFSFAVFPVKISENLEKNLNLDDAIMDLAKRKGTEALKAHNFLNTDHFLVLAADTMVIYNNIPMGKPSTKIEAETMLGQLSGKNHLVKTAICIIESLSKKTVTAIETTKVYFRPISRQEIVDYVNTGEPMDKAGAYGIQGMGGNLIEKYVGPLDNVVGLPIGTLNKLLKQNGWAKE